jgi:hypothetical protein
MNHRTQHPAPGHRAGLSLDSPRDSWRAWAGPLSVTWTGGSRHLPGGSRWERQIGSLVAGYRIPQLYWPARRCWAQWAQGRCPQCRGKLLSVLGAALAGPEARSRHKTGCSESWRLDRLAIRPWAADLGR